MAAPRTDLHVRLSVLPMRWRRPTQFRSPLPDTDPLARTQTAITSFFQKQEVVAVLPPAAAPPAPCKQCRINHTGFCRVGYELNGHVRRRSQQSAFARLYSQFEPLARAATPRDQIRTPQAYTTGVKVDPSGQYIAASSLDGRLQIYEFSACLALAASAHYHMDDPASDAANDYEDSAHPLLCFGTQQKSEAIAWNPTKQNEISLAFSSKRDLHLYNLETCTRDPSVVLRSPPGTSGNFDVQYACVAGGSEPVVLAGGLDCAIKIWDVRKPQKPARVLIDRDSCAITSIQVSTADGGNAIYCGTEAGLVCCWDVRYTGHISRRVDIRRFFSAHVSNELGDAAGAVTSIAFDPSVAGGRIGFQLRNSWAGIVDMSTDDAPIKSYYCPPSMASSGGETWLVRARRVAFTRHGEPFMAMGIAGTNRVAMVNLSDSAKLAPAVEAPQAGGSDAAKFAEHTAKNYDKENGTTNTRNKNLGTPAPSVVEVATPTPVVCVDVHPTLDYIVAGLVDNSVVLLGAPLRTKPVVVDLTLSGSAV